MEKRCRWPRADLLKRSNQRVSWAARAPGGCETHSRARRYRSSSCCRAAGPCEGPPIERCARGGLSSQLVSPLVGIAIGIAVVLRWRCTEEGRAMPIQPTRTCEQISWDECGGRALQVPSHDRHSAPTVRVEAGSRARKGQGGFESTAHRMPLLRGPYEQDLEICSWPTLALASRAPAPTL